MKKTPTQTQTDPTTRTFRSALVGWCSDCRLYTDPMEGACPGMCDTPNGRARRQVKRRMLICSACATCFPHNDRLGAEEHDCNEYLP